MNVLQYAVKWVIFLCSTVLFLSYLYNLCELYEIHITHTKNLICKQFIL